MSRILHILLLALLLLSGCSKEETPSYVGRWEYLDSDPDLGPAYKESYLEVQENWNFTFYDAPSGKTVSGTPDDFTNEGLTITMTPAPKYDFPSITFKLTRLKDNLMEVETEDVGEGHPTTIHFSRVGGY